MKKVAGTLKLALLAVPRAAERSRSSAPTSTRIPRSVSAQGERIVEVLKQPQNSPIPVEKQVIIIYAVVYGLSARYSGQSRSATFEKELFEYIDGTYGDIPETIRATGKLEDDVKSRLTQAIEEFKNKFLSEH